MQLISKLTKLFEPRPKRKEYQPGDMVICTKCFRWGRIGEDGKTTLCKDCPAIL